MPSGIKKRDMYRYDVTLRQKFIQLLYIYSLKLFLKIRIWL